MILIFKTSPPVPLLMDLLDLYCEVFVIGEAPRLKTGFRIKARSWDGNRKGDQGIARLCNFIQLF